MCKTISRLKILVVSNFYPPHHFGGYELGCKEVVDRLVDRGHVVDVITSFHGIGVPVSDGHIYRHLDARLSWPTGTAAILPLIRKERNNQRAFNDLVSRLKPDLIYIWNAWCGCVSLCHAAARTCLPTVYFISDEWLRRWAKDDQTCRLLNRPAVSLRGRLGVAATRFGVACSRIAPPIGSPAPHLVQFCSEFLLRRTEESLKLPQTEVCHWGVETENFSAVDIHREPRRVLVAGQVMPHKGTHTAVKAFLAVAEEEPWRELRLTVVGGSVDEGYVQSLRALASASPVGMHVNFQDRVTRKELRSLYASHELFIFPSEWEEPFSISLLEAMAAGLAVVSTKTGGTGEVLCDGNNGLVFETGNVSDCARKLRRLLDDSALYRKIRWQARETVRNSFTMLKMVDHIERSLLNAVGCRGSH